MKYGAKHAAVTGIILSAVLFLFPQGAKACEQCGQCGGAKKAKAEVSGRVTDPVCGMKVDPKTAEKKGLVAKYRGRKYYFCMKADLEKFKKNPEKYLKNQKGMQHGGIHERMMQNYAEVIKLEGLLLQTKNASRGVKIADAFVKKALEFVNRMNEMTRTNPGMMKKDSMMAQHYKQLKKLLRTLTALNTQFKAALQKPRQEKLFAQLKTTAAEFVKHMKKCHGMMMKHMGAGKGMMKGH